MIKSPEITLPLSFEDLNVLDVALAGIESRVLAGLDPPGGLFEARLRSVQDKIIAALEARLPRADCRPQLRIIK